MNKYILFHQVYQEIDNAVENYPTFHSLYEGYAVLLEEVDELWTEVKKKQVNRDKDKIHKECIQVASMALRIIIDCEKEDYLK